MSFLHPSVPSFSRRDGHCHVSWVPCVCACVCARAQSPLAHLSTFSLFTHLLLFSPNQAWWGFDTRVSGPAQMHCVKVGNAAVVDISKVWHSQGWRQHVPVGAALAGAGTT